MHWREFVVALGLVSLLLSAAGCFFVQPVDKSELLETHVEELRGTHGVIDPCGHSDVGLPGTRHEHFLHWASDGSHLVFDVDDGLWTLDIDTGTLREVADMDVDYEPSEGNTYYRFQYPYHADLRSQDNLIVYSTCEYMRDEPLIDNIYDNVLLYSEGFEIATVNFDGSSPRRETQTEYLTNYPVWSPDGRKIALVANEPEDQDHFYILDHHDFRRSRFPETRLAIISYGSTNGGFAKVNWLQSTSDLILYPPAWSQDGQHLAYIAFDSQYPYRNWFLYTVRSDGTKRSVRIGQTATLPTWSPNGQELAYATKINNRSIVFAIKPNGSGRRVIWRNPLNAYSPNITDVSWSPDGSELLLVSSPTSLVNADGGDLRHLEGIPKDYQGVRPTAWSPDSLRIAIYNPDRGLITISPDGTHLRVLLEIDSEGQPRMLAPTAIASP